METTTPDTTALIHQALEIIASQSLDIDTLETRRSDSLDFHDVAVWGVKEALIMAAWVGKAIEAELAVNAGDNDRHVGLLGEIEQAIPEVSAKLYRIATRVVDAA